jgi:hypothetical protein
LKHSAQNLLHRTQLIASDSDLERPE